MVTQWLEAAKILHDGKIDVMRTVVFGLPIVLFLAWRLSSHGVYGAERLMRTVERDLVENYQQSVYKRYGFYDNDGERSAEDAAAAAEALDGIEVELSSVSMSGPLFSWAVNDEVGIRFDYTLTKDGEVLRREEDVYRCTHKQSRTTLWECGAVSYYLKYL